MAIEGDGLLTALAHQITRKTYRLGGQTIAVRVSGDPTAGNNGLFYVHSDHLSSAHILTRHSDGYVEAGSLARYEPFGDWRTEPTTNPALSGRGFTGHRHNNTGANDLGLIYMRARFYVPSIGRFASADTIVPDAEDPQSFNRYAYVRNNPLKYVDPSGHCWGFASGLRNTFYQTTCENIDQAVSIIQHPDASVGEKALAVTYVGVETVAHGTVVAGTGVVAVGCLTGAGTIVCTGAGSAATAASADGDPINELNTATNAISNILSRITPTQSNWAGTNLPRSFRISTPNGNFWIHPNATKHMKDLLTRTPRIFNPSNPSSYAAPRVFANKTTMSQQILLESLDDAIVRATNNGIVYDQMIRIGNWELMFGRPVEEGLLPVLYHANYITP